MKFCFFLLALILVPVLAQAKTGPDYISVAGGDFDFDKDQARRKSVDYRLEYQWGVSLLPHIRYLQLHPTVGVEGNSKGMLYGNGGLNLDLAFLRHGIVTWGEAAGDFSHGNDAAALAPLEFRSQLELGWRFDNNMRVTGFFSHISNAGLEKDNTGAEIIGMYLHIPLSRSARR